ncbi:hypothetical protein PAMP_023073 [Pampus punctatissimus]
MKVQVQVFHITSLPEKVTVCGGTRLLQSFLRRTPPSRFPSASKMDQRDTLSHDGGRE